MQEYHNKPKTSKSQAFRHRNLMKLTLEGKKSYTFCNWNVIALVLKQTKFPTHNIYLSILEAGLSRTASFASRVTCLQISLVAKLFACRGVRLRPKIIWYNLHCSKMRLFNTHFNQPLQNSHIQELSPKCILKHSFLGSGKNWIKA